MKSLKRISGFIIIISLLLVFNGCYLSVRTPEQLLKQAKAKHGECTLVSKEEKNSCVTISVEDEAQHFVYTLTSVTVGFLDGGEIEGLYTVHDHFNDAYGEFVLAKMQEFLEDIAQRYSVTYDTHASDYYGPNVYIYTDKEETGIDAAKEILTEMKKYSYKKRMKEANIYVLRPGGSVSNKESVYGVISVPKGKYVKSK